MSATINALPVVTIPHTLQRNRYEIPFFQIDTPHGPIEVQVGRCQELWCVGSPDAIIAHGLILPEWLPGIPGNNPTAQRVAFEAQGPRLIIGKQTGKRQKKQTRIVIQAWGFIKRTAVVRIPMTPSQIDQMVKWEAHEEQQDEYRRSQPRAKPEGLHTAGSVIQILAYRAKHDVRFQDFMSNFRQ